MSPLVRFLPRQLADHLLTRGAAMFVIGVVMLLPFLLAIEPDTGLPLERLLRQGLNGATPFLTLVATYGIIDQDVRQGYYRFLLSKPIPPVGYYTTAFLVSVVTFLVVVALLIGVVAVVRRPVWPGVHAIADVTFLFLLLGALVFAFSRFTRADWVFGIAVLLSGSAVRHRWPPDESGLGAVLNVILPPEQPRSFFPAGTPDWPEIGWTLGYAAAALIVGLLAVRFIPFGERH